MQIKAGLHKKNIKSSEAFFKLASACPTNYSGGKGADLYLLNYSCHGNLVEPPTSKEYK